MISRTGWFLIHLTLRRLPEASRIHQRGEGLAWSADAPRKILRSA